MPPLIVFSPLNMNQPVLIQQTTFLTYILIEQIKQTPPITFLYINTCISEENSYDLPLCI